MSVMHRIQKLLFSSEPVSDESFTGYLLRLTERNRVPTTSWLTREAGIKNYLHSGLSLVAHNSLNLLPLAALTGVNEKRLQELLYHPANDDRKRMGDCLVFGWPVPVYIIHSRQPKVCPQCLREASYLRKVWDLAPVTACPIHNCLLLDECPSCLKSISWARNRINYCRCEYDWREFTPSLVEDATLKVTQHIYQLCQLSFSAPSKIYRPSRGNLFDLGLQDFISALLFVASQFAGIIDTKGKHLARKKTNKELHELLYRALIVFNDWPNNYYSFLDWRRAEESKKNRNELPSWQRELTGWQKDFVEYKSALFVQLASPQFNFLRNAFAEYVKLRRHEGFITNAQLNNTTMLIDEAPDSKRVGIPTYISRAEAKRMLRICPTRIEELVNSGRLRAIISQRGAASRVFLIERASVEELTRERENTLLLKQVRELLGLPSFRVTELVDGNILSRTNTAYENGRIMRTFNREQINNLLHDLERKIPTDKRITIKDSGSLSFRQTLKMITPAKINLATFTIDILNDTIKPCGGSTDLGYQKLIFSKDEISYYAHIKLRPQIEGYVSLLEVARQLKMCHAAVRILAKKHILPPVNLLGFRPLGLFVSLTELELFQSSYYWSSKLAREYAISQSLIPELLYEIGITPVSGPDVDGGIIYVFKKSDIDSIDLATLAINKLNFKKQLSPQSISKTLDETQAAKLLGVDEIAIRLLVSRGLIKPHKRIVADNGEKGKYWFSLASIEKYKKEIASRGDLVTFLAAAKMFGLRPDNFSNKYIRTQRLKPALTNRRRSRNCFYMKDVEELLEIEKETVISREAAEILGISVSGLANMIDSGILKPISGPNVDGFGLNLFLRSDVEKFRVEREAYKEKRIKEGGAGRFGRPRRQRTRPVLDVIGPRIERLLETWRMQAPDSHISGYRLYQQLIKEGYKLGIAAVYEYLRQMHRRAA